MKIAVEGCAHGELDKIYETISHLESENDIKVDLLIICGDFQAVRNPSDLSCMAVPKKYQKLNTFYKYYSGESRAPVLTLFVGGNHEASNYLSELSYGGWVCPNIYYMGNASVVNIGGVRIAGLSGIYKGHDYLKGHFEILPYEESTKRSVYHIRNIDVFRLKQIKTPLDICISHDWPRGIYNYGDKEGLLRFKPYFKNDIENNKLGSRPAEELLMKLCPDYWFAAHLHCKFAAVVPHETQDGNKCTKFLALDKCLPRKRFLQIFDIESDSSRPIKLHFDPEWLSILHSTNHLLSVKNVINHMPGPGCTERWDFSPSVEEIENILKLLDGNLEISENFEKTAPPYNSGSQGGDSELEVHINPQTTRLCKLLKIDDPLELLVRSTPQKMKPRNFSFVADLNVTSTSQSSINPDEISLTDDFDSDDQDNASNTENITSDLETTSSSSFFYIDKKPMSTFSKNQGELSFQERSEIHFSTSTPVSKSNTNIDSSEFPEFKHQTEDNKDEVSNTKASPVLVMKRRNQALYMNNDEEKSDSDN